jgi:hypothetical protein
MSQLRVKTFKSKFFFRERAMLLIVFINIYLCLMFVRETENNHQISDQSEKERGAVESKSFHRVGVVNKIYHNLFFSFSAFLSSLLRRLSRVSCVFFYISFFLSLSLSLTLHSF